MIQRKITMRYCIRSSIFETNSSSVHAICIGKHWDRNSLPSDIIFKEGEFGSGFNTYNTMQDRASYLYTTIVAPTRLLRDRIRRETEEPYKSHIPEEIKQQHKTQLAERDVWSTKMLQYVINTIESYGVKVHILDTKNHKGYNSNFDDMNIDAWLHSLENPELLMTYLFSDESKVETGNDWSNDYEIPLPGDDFEDNKDYTTFEPYSTERNK